MKLIFFGSDDFALTNLEALMGARAGVVAVVTQPDRKKGRGMKVSEPVIKTYAQKHKLPVLQPEDVADDEFLAALKKFEADLFVVIAYGRILPKSVLSIPRTFAVNVHGSLLPKYRGAAPVNWAIINGDTQTGVTVIKMNERMDAGEIISSKAVAIDAADTAGSLRLKMAQESAKLLLETIERIKHLNYSLTKQDLSQVTHASKVTKELGLITWSDEAAGIHNLVRGLSPRPGAFTYFKGKQLKILSASLTEAKGKKGKPGEILEIAKNGLSVAAGAGTLLIKDVHLESSRPMPAKSFADGQRLKAGDILG